MYSDVVNWHVRAVFPTPEAPSIATLNRGGVVPCASQPALLHCDAELKHDPVISFSPLFVKLKLWDHFGDLGIHERIILKWMLNTWVIN
jgi:hypothetical protein